MKVNLLTLLLLFSINLFSQNTTIYRARDGRVIDSEKYASTKIERKLKSKNKIAVQEYRKLGNNWHSTDQEWSVSKKKDGKYKLNYYKRGSFINSLFVEIIDTLSNGYLIKEYEGNFCFAEAEVYSVFPLIFNGQCTYHFKDKASQTMYYFYDKKYFNVNQPKLENIELPKNSCNQVPRFPGGSKNLNSLISKKKLISSEQVAAGMEGKRLINFTINKEGELVDLKLLDGDNPPLLKLITGKINSIHMPWIPAQDKGEPVDYTYVWEIELKGKKIPDVGDVLVTADKMPCFPGGELGLRKYIASLVRYPMEAQKSGTEGKVFVNFIVDTKGVVRNPKILRSVDPLLDEEALRVVSALPKWQPGEQDGEKVCVSYTVPISFKLRKPAVTIENQY